MGEIRKGRQMNLYATIVGYVDSELTIGEIYTVTRGRNCRVLTATNGESIKLTDWHFTNSVETGKITLSN